MTSLAGVVGGLCLSALLAPAEAGEMVAASQMTVSFSWKGIQGCVEEERSPSFNVQHAPENTRFLIFSLTDASGVSGPGQYVNYSADGVVRAGAVSYRPPCRPGVYRWSIIATNRSGDFLAGASAEGAFPAE